MITGRRAPLVRMSWRHRDIGAVSRPSARLDAQEERDTMQRGRYLHLAALAGALTLAAGIASAAALSPPVGIFTADVGMTNGTHVGSGTTTVTGSGADAVYTINAIGWDITGSK